MAFGSEVLPYDEARAKLGSGRVHVLLGNGFRIACDPIFSYSRLYDAAVGAGLSERAQQVLRQSISNLLHRKVLEAVEFVLEEELTEALGTARYERSEERRGYRTQGRTPAQIVWGARDVGR